MAEGFQGRVLKSNLARTVYVDRHGAVVKRFHNPSAVQALRDRGRAVSERRVLDALLACKLPVPKALEVRRVPGAWEVVMERIEGAVQLGAILTGEAPAPIELNELAARIGAVLARAHAAGLDHPDLHPGNVLLDGSGQPWLVDFHKARVRPRSARGIAERDLVALLSAVRETLSAEGRLRLLEAWADTSETTPERGLEAFCAELENRGWLHRRALVAHAQGRWTRESSSCCVVERNNGPLFLRRGLDPTVAEALESRIGSKSAVLNIGDTRVFVLVGLPPTELRARWYNAVRLADHRLPVLLPLASSGRMAAFEVPDGARPIPSADLTPQMAGALLGALHDRGLDLATLGPEVWVNEHGAWLAPPPRLQHIDARPGRLSNEKRFAGARELDVSAYVAAFRGGTTEQAALRRELN